eukprot:1282673-Pyramimonas_sp.AAC.1
MAQSKCWSQNVRWHLSQVHGASSTLQTMHLTPSDMAGLDRESSRWDMAPPFERTRVADAETALLTAFGMS